MGAKGESNRSYACRSRALFVADAIRNVARHSTTLAELTEGCNTNSGMPTGYDDR